MKINHNISALKANVQLNKNDNAMSKSLEKLTSGFKINNASDDPAGMAISRKMKAQIRGLEKASSNASDGISVIQTAEGALEEVSSCLQRMNELAVQAANGTYTTEDRNAIQLEIDQLNEEIQRISDTTEFNTKKLLDGSVDRKSYTDSLDVKIIAIADEVAASDKYHIVVQEDPRQAVVLGQSMKEGIKLTDTIFDIDQNDKHKKQEAAITVNGQTILINETDTYNSVYEKLRDLCSSIDINCFVTDMKDSVDVNGNPINDTNGNKVIEPYKYNPANYESAGYQIGKIGEYPKDDTGNVDSNQQQALVFVSELYGSNQQITVSCNDENIAKKLGILRTDEVDDPNNPGTKINKPSTTLEGKGVDAKVEVNKNPNVENAFAETATVFADGEVVRITDNSGFEIKFEVAPNTTGPVFKDEQGGNNGNEKLPEIGTDGEDKNVRLTVLEAGEMSLHIGANAYQTMKVTIPAVTPKTLGVNIVNVRTKDGAEKAIDIIGEAIIDLSTIRAKLGAYENRLEHAISNIDTTNENMTESLSRIEDTDMAKEMANYTQYSVLVQASTSMLAQANERPQNILSLLQ